MNTELNIRPSRKYHKPNSQKYCSFSSGYSRNIQQSSHIQLVNVEVEFLYNNIPWKSGINICHKFLSSFNEPEIQWWECYIGWIHAHIQLFQFPILIYINTVNLQHIGAAVESQKKPEYPNLFMVDHNGNRNQIFITAIKTIFQCINRRTWYNLKYYTLFSSMFNP